MARLRFNGVSGTAAGNGITLTAGGTTATWAVAPPLPTISSSDYVPIIIFPGDPTEEIVWLSPYTAGATTGTVVRNAEPTQAGQNSNAAHTGVSWLHGPTAMDFSPPILSGHLGGDVSLTGSLATIFSTSTLAVGQWEITIGLSTANTGANSVNAFQIVQGTAVATFDGQVSMEAETFSGTDANQTFTFTANVTTAGALACQGFMASGTTSVVKATGVVGGLAKATGWVARYCP